MPKGSNYERDVCKQLSLWWSNGKREDIFWRTSGSGARATTRSKTKQKTFGQYGDVQATDPIGQPLIDLCTIELKRGYSHETFANLIETSQTANARPCMYSKFIEQAQSDMTKSDALWWLLIVKRDRRKPIIIFPRRLFNKNSFAGLDQVRIFRRGKVNIRIALLDDFLEYMKPIGIIELHKEYEEEDDDCKRCTKPTCANCYREDK